MTPNRFVARTLYILQIQSPNLPRKKPRDGFLPQNEEKLPCAAQLLQSPGDLTRYCDDFGGTFTPLDFLPDTYFTVRTTYFDPNIRSQSRELPTHLALSEPSLKMCGTRSRMSLSSRQDPRQTEGRRGDTVRRCLLYYLYFVLSSCSRYLASLAPRRLCRIP